MKRVHIVGRKNSGKTTLVAELVRELTRQGLRIATVKHTHHHHELDTPGKDSHQHREAGAAKVAILAPGMTAVFESHEASLSSQARLDQACQSFGDCDLVLIEGGLQCAGPKIEVWRRDVSPQPIAVTDDSILGLVSDDEHQLPIPSAARSQPQEILALVQKLARA